MNEIVQGWLSNLYADALADARAAIQNERIWANGSPDAETAAMHEGNIALQEEYAKALTELLQSVSGNVSVRDLPVKNETTTTK